MIFSNIRNGFNKLTPGISFKNYARQVLYKGQDCGYIEAAGKRKYVLTPALDKLEHKMELNNFNPSMPRFITPNEFKMFKILLKPFIRNEKGLKKLNINKDLYYSPSPSSIVIWDKQSKEPVVSIIKSMKNPTSEIFYHRFPFLRKWHRISPY